MRLAFVVDPLDHSRPTRIPRIAMMREAARRGHEIHALEARAMSCATAVSRPRSRLDVRDDDDWYRARARRALALPFDASSCARTRPSTRSTTTRRCCSSAPRPRARAS
jgi:glutathione synthase